MGAVPAAWEAPGAGVVGPRPRGSFVLGATGGGLGVGGGGGGRGGGGEKGEAGEQGEGEEGRLHGVS